MQLTPKRHPTFLEQNIKIISPYLQKGSIILIFKDDIEPSQI